MAKGRVEFTKEDDKNLVAYLAEQCPETKGRQGPALYKRLTEDTKKWPWSKRHSLQSWLQRYRGHAERFDRAVYEYLKDLAKENGTKPPPPPSQNLSPTKSQRVPFTKDDDKKLAQYLALAAPIEKGRHGDNVYRILSERSDLYPWATSHPWQSWQQRFKKSPDFFNELIRKYQRSKGIDPKKGAPTIRRPAVSKSNNTKGPTVSTSKLSKKPTVDDKEVGQKRKLSPDNPDEPQKKKRRVEEPKPRSATPVLSTQEIVKKQPSKHLKPPRQESVLSQEIPLEPAPEPVRKSKKQTKPQEAPPKVLPPLPADDDYTNALDASSSEDDTETDEDEEDELNDDITRVVEPEPKVLKKRSLSLEYIDPEPDLVPQPLPPRAPSIAPPPVFSREPIPSHSPAHQDISGHYVATSTPRKQRPPASRLPLGELTDLIFNAVVESAQVDRDNADAPQAGPSQQRRSASPLEQDQRPQELAQEKPQSKTGYPSPVTPKVKRKRRAPADDEDWFESSSSRHSSPSPTPSPQKPAKTTIEPTSSPATVKRKPPALVEGAFNSAFTNERGKVVFDKGLRRRSGLEYLEEGTTDDGQAKSMDSRPAWPPKRKRREETAPPAKGPQVNKQTEEQHDPTPGPSSRRPSVRKDVNRTEPLPERAQTPPVHDEERPVESDESDSQNAVEQALFTAAGRSQSQSQEGLSLQNGEHSLPRNQPTQVPHVSKDTLRAPQSGSDPRVRGEVVVPQRTPSQGQRFFGMIKNAINSFVEGTPRENQDAPGQERPPSPSPAASVSASVSRQGSISPERPDSRASTVHLPTPDHVSPNPFILKEKGKGRAFAPSPPSLARRQRAERRHTTVGVPSRQGISQPRDFLRARLSNPTPFRNTPRTSNASSSASSTRSLHTFEGKPISEKDITFMIKDTLERIASNHGFQASVAHEMWKLTGDLQKTDMALMRMRQAAQEAAQKLVDSLPGEDSQEDVSVYIPLEGTRAAAARASMSVDDH